MLWPNKAVYFLLSLAFIYLYTNTEAQNTNIIAGQDTLQNLVTSTLVFLRIATDSRSGAMGETGIALSPDANSIHWNSAKLAFIEKEIGYSISVTPWLRKIVSDMNFTYLSGYLKINQIQTIALSFTYFDLGNLSLTDRVGQTFKDINSKEYSLSFAYSRKISENFGAAITGRFIVSDLSGNIINPSGNEDLRVITTGSADFSIFYRNRKIQLKNFPATLAFGVNISNIGPKVTYSSDNNSDFIPTNLGIGTALTMEVNPFNKLTFALDANKLLVPTPNRSVARGSNEDPNLLSGIFNSFSDAPGGLSEELSEIILSVGVEYWYNSLFALRGGYFHESSRKGNRKFFTLGLGIKYKKIGLDFAYLVANRQGNPLDDTLRFTFYMNFNRKIKGDRRTDTNRLAK